MSFKFSHGRAKTWLMLCVILTSWHSIAAENNLSESNHENVSDNKASFSAQPANCIALRHGRTCYANVTLNWVSANKQDYCIYIKQPKKERTEQQSIKCWKSSSGNQVIFNFESNKKIEFQLISSKDNRVIAETAVEVSWVHKATPRKRRWRIF
jgi:hypothetical protein